MRASVRCNRFSRRREGGFALIAILALMGLVGAYLLVNQLGNSSTFTAANRNHNARVLNEAKQALIGYVAQHAANGSENNPGRLPCPEAPGYFGTSSEGVAAGSCTLPAVGRFPWRTLGLDKLVDAANEPLWYVVSSDWALPNTSARLTINSNMLGQLNVDGTPNDSIALLIAPGPAFTPLAPCSAPQQVRTTSGPPDFRNYLECENASSPVDVNFVTTGTSTSFNDQVLRVTTADILPPLEAAIAYRFSRDIAPAIRSIYSNTYGTNSSWPTTNPVLPFAAPFESPSTSAMQGAAGTSQGLLPLTYSETTPGTGTPCTTGGDLRCAPTFVAWGASPPTLSGASVYSPSCSSTATQISCTYYYQCPLSGCGSTNVPFQLTSTASNVGMALRQLNSAATMTNIDTASRSVSGTLNSDGSATIVLNATAIASGSGSFVSNTLCAISLPLSLVLGCKQDTIAVPIALLADHPLLNPNDPTYGWFLRNHWDQVAYYAVAPGITPSGGGSCTSGIGGTCLNVIPAPNDVKERGLVVFSGRSLTGTSRPNGSLIDWLEDANYTSANTSGKVFETRSTSLISNRTFNDRIAVIDANP